MLQAPSPLSKVYAHSHIKKFWLMQTQKESENKALLSSSSSSFCRNGASSPGKVHESKHIPQLTSGNPSARTLSAGASSPSALPVRLLVPGPGGSFGGASTRHASIVTCAESLSPPLCSDHSSTLSRPSSPNISASNSKEESDLLAEVTDCNPFKSPPQGSDLSASSSRCGSPRSHEHEPLKVTIPYHSNFHDRCRDSPAAHQDDVFLQESFDHVKSSASTHSGNHSLGPCNDDPGKASNSDSGNFDLSGSPVRLPTKGLFEKPFEGKPFGKVSTEGKPFDKAEPSTGELGKVKSPEGCRAATKCESFEDAHPVRGSVARTCSLCGTSKTPLWRSGPQGPKSLCNACGIRFKKSKRWSGPSDSSDQTAASLASPDSTKVSFRPPKRKQETLLSTAEAHWPRDVGPEAAVAGVASQQAKKSRWSMIMKGQLPRRTQEVTGSSGESCLTWNLHSPSSVSPHSVKEFEKLAIGDQHRAVNRVDGKDDIEAAALLMYLSCGLVYA